MMTYLIIAIVVALVVWRATRVIRWWLTPTELPEPRRPFLTDLQVQKLERKLGIGVAEDLPLSDVVRQAMIDAGTTVPLVITRDDVAKIAVEMIAQGQARDVKAALEDLMVSKVSHLEDHQLVRFVRRLQEYAEMDDDPHDDEDGLF